MTMAVETIHTKNKFESNASVSPDEELPDALDVGTSY